MAWIHDARCVGQKPSLFDHFTFPEAKPALALCHTCTVITECLEWVKPQKSMYDGVAGGVVWRNGYRVRPDNSTREDRIIRLRMLRGEAVESTEVPEIHGQGTLPFD